MFAFLQILTILGMIFMTYVAFLSFGGPKKNLLFTKAEKEEWDQSFGKSGLTKWFTVTNIVGSLTSLATAYLFFIGNSKLFGWAMGICALTIWLGSYVTNYVTKNISKIDYIQDLLASKKQVGGVISTLFWRPQDQKSIQTAVVIKWLSIINITGVIWLEFALFSDIASMLFSLNQLHYKVIIIFLTTIIVVYFTVKFGLRGYVFADFFQSPLIGLSAIGLIVGCIILVIKRDISFDLYTLTTPLLSIRECIIFSFHVLFLNSFLVLVTEGHWLRVWIFGKQETKMQVLSLTATAAIWILLIIVGFFTYILSGSQFGEAAIVKLLLGLNQISPLFIILFWVGGIAALFSTADAQIYSLLLVNEFDSRQGVLKNKLMDKMHPLLLSLVFSFGFTVLYFLVRYYSIPFEKIVFMVIPFSLNILPAFIRLIKGYSPRPVLICLSTAIYLLLSLFGFLSTEHELSWNLAAVSIPVIFSVFALRK